ncbi:MAG: MaoC family dehydratase, partial [Deltaproteobacteria bacterium]|nr:MaoC family dehydratase [Deltaproteobacteria bacterium]
SMSVHDVSQQGVAHMAYVHVRFPKPLHAGTTVNAVSRVINTRPSGGRTRGVVHIHTVLLDDHHERVVDLERLALVRPGRLTKRPGSPQLRDDDLEGKLWMGRLPQVDAATQLSNATPSSLRFEPPLFGCFEDLTPGTVFVHAVGRTIGESEPMQLATLLRNTHPMHVDERYCRREGPTPTRMVYGGLVMAWVVSLASVDLGGHLLWDVVWKEGAHPGFVAAGDTVYAATKVLEADPVNERVGLVKLRHVGVKNTRPSELLDAGADLFGPELGKPADSRIQAKVFEITRTILVRRFGK